MVIKQLYVEKFRKLNDFRIDLGNNITIISGHNGTMKSTILGLLMQPFDVSAESEKQKLDKENFRTIHNKFAQSKFSDHFEFNYPNYDKPKELQAEIFLHDGFNEKSYPFETILRDKKSNKLRIWKKGDRSKGSGYIKGVPVIYHDLGRLYPLQKTSYSMDSLGVLSAEEIELFKDYYNRVFKSNPINISNVFPVEIKGLNKASLGFTSSKYDFTTLSSGEDSVCNIIASILSVLRIKKRHNENKEKYMGSIVLIDELDASLHPPIQKNLMELLNTLSGRLNIQFIITTHSTDLIEWAYDMRVNNMKNARTRNNINVIYLVNQGNSVIPHTNPELFKLINHLKLEDRSKISVYAEDKEAAVLIKGMLDRDLLKQVEVKYSSLSCSVLKPMVLSKDFVLTDNVIVCLDGDERKQIEKELEGRSECSNLIVLPGECNPEAYIYNYLVNLESSHEIWENPLDGNFYKEFILQNSPSAKSFTSHSEKCQEWFQTLFDEIIPDKEHFFKTLKKDNSEECIKFNSAFKEALQFVQSNNLSIPSTTIEKNKQVSESVRNNDYVMLVENMFNYAIDNKMKSFHPSYYPSQEYKNLESADKKFVYQLFRSLYTPGYFKESNYSYTFLANLK